MIPRKHSWSRRVVFFAVTACLLLALASVATAGVAAQEDWDDDELLPAGQQRVDDTERPPVSAVGAITTAAEPHQNPKKRVQATGVLVSPRHVLTNAHVVEGFKERDETLRFVPARDTAVVSGHPYDADRQTQPFLPFGEGYALDPSDATVHPQYDHNGGNKEYDLAVVTLDRPIGLFAGTIDVETPGESVFSDSSESFTLHGYPVEPSVPWLSEGRIESDEISHEDSLPKDGTYLRYDDALEDANGNSGGPILRHADGEASVVGVHWGEGSQGTWGVHPAAVYITNPIRRWIADEIDDDRYARSHPDLVVSDADGRLGNTEGNRVVANEPVTGTDGFVTPVVTIANVGAGAAAGSVNEDLDVEFYVDADDGNPVLCTDTIESIESQSTAYATCTATEFSNVPPGSHTVKVRVDPEDEIEEYTDEYRDGDDEPVGDFEVEQRHDWNVTEVRAPHRVAAGGDVGVAVRIENLGSHRSTAAVSVNGLSHVQCGSRELSQTLDPGAERTLHFDCTAADVEDATGSFEVVLEPETGSTLTEEETVQIRTEPYERGDFELRDVQFQNGFNDLPRIEPGGTISVTATVENVGDEAGYRTVGYANHRSENWRDDASKWASFTCVETKRPEERVELGPGEQTSIEQHCRLPSEVPTGEYEVGFTIYEEHGLPRVPYTVAEPRDPDFKVDSAAPAVWDGRVAPDQIVVGEQYELGAWVDNYEGAPAEQPVEFRVDGETVATKSTYLERNGFVELTEQWTPAPGSNGRVELSVVTPQDRATNNVTVEPMQFDVELVSSPDVVERNGTVATELQVTNRGSSSDVHTLALSVGNRTITERDVALDAGESRTVTLRGRVVEAPVGGSVSLDVAGPTNGSSTSATVVADCTRVQEYTVCDVNGDGLYRDVTGDGAVGQADVSVFFNHQHREEWKRPELFDFSGNGAVNTGDVSALFDYVALN